MYKNIIFVILQIFFIVWIGVFYISDENINRINKSRSINYTYLNSKITEIPSLENDTIDIIEFTNRKEKKKYNKFFELLRNNEK